MTNITHLPPLQGPWVDIDLGALCANYVMLRDSAPNAHTAAVVKCDGYGLGLEPVARALSEQEKCRIFFVVYAEEGATLRKALGGNDAEIYALAGPAPETMPLFESAQVIPVINTMEQARLWASRCPGAPAAVHVDTGMNRIGVCMSDAGDIAKIKNLNVTMIMSHLACASDPAHPLNQAQRTAFQEAAQHFPGAKLSLAASGGALTSPDFHFDLLRPGIALYGGSPFADADERIKPVAALRAPVVQMRDLAPGQTVGYDATFVAPGPTRIATIALGYGDGYPRASGPARYAFINDERAPIAGRVSMDFITLDVTKLRNPPKVGDVAELYGPNLPIHDVAKTSGRIAYDLLTGLGGRVNRRYL